MDEAMTPREAAAVMKKSIRRVYQLMNAGTFELGKRAGKTVIYTDSILEYLRTKKINPNNH